MTCDRATERMVDRVYGELGEAASAELDAHLAGCPSCRGELAKLRLARSLLARGRQGEPGGSPLAEGDLPSRRVRRTRLWLAAAVAAAVLIGVTLWLFQKTATTPAIAKPMPPVVIERIGVSLTILSQPDNWPGRFEWRDGQPGQAPPNPRAWPGMALVRDRRLVRHLRPGGSRIRLTGVPSGILPDSVRLRGLDHADGLTILEQNYQYDLASASAVLKRYVDKPIAVRFRRGREAQGRLLSFDPSSLVIQPAGSGPRTLDAASVAAVTFGKLPEGLLTRPTLVWHVHNRAAAARQRFEVAYLTHGLNWRADYVLKLRPGRKPGGEGAVVDLADLVGYATVINRSGATYESAGLKLLAGDVNLVRPKVFVDWWAELKDDKTETSNEKHAPQFREKSFFEYHLYTLGRPTTLRNAETKQIELLSGRGIRLTRGYVYDPQRDHKTAARVVSEMVNSEANGLGKPLPKGVMRLYAPDPEGVQTYVHQTSIDHTPVEEKLRLRWGHAFDIVGTYKQTRYVRTGSRRDRTWKYDLRNHKDHDVTITVVAHVPKTTFQAKCGHRWHVREVGLVEIDVPVKSNGAAVVTFSHSYDYSHGGGLTSPHDNKKR